MRKQKFNLIFISIQPSEMYGTLRVKLQNWKIVKGRTVIKPLSANITKWSHTHKQFVGKLPTNRLSVFDHFVGLALKGLRELLIYSGKRYGVFRFLKFALKKCTEQFSAKLYFLKDSKLCVSKLDFYHYFHSFRNMRYY